MGWSYSFWVNNFYSTTTKPDDFLTEYSKYFDTVEVNSSFYRVPSVSVLEKWKTQTPDSFLFSIKAPKKITHGNFGKEAYDYLDYFLENVATLGSKLGTLLFQFPPNFKFDSLSLLKNLVSTLSNNYRYVIEVRNASWGKDIFYELLKENNISLVFTDARWFDKLEKVTADLVYFRWEGNRKQVIGTKGIVEKDKTGEIQNLADKIRSLSNEVEVFGYFSKYFSGHPPTDVKKLLEFLSAKH